MTHPGVRRPRSILAQLRRWALRRFGWVDGWRQGYRDGLDYCDERLALDVEHGHTDLAAALDRLREATAARRRPEPW